MASARGFLCFFLINLKFLARVVGLDGAGLDDHVGVAFLPGLASRRDRPRHVATRQSESRCERREGGDEDGDDQFQDFFLSHRWLGLKG